MDLGVPNTAKNGATVNSTDDNRGGPGDILVFCCSGAADVGEIAHRAARRLDDCGLASRFCLAGIGGRVKAMLQKVRDAKKVLVIDGCNVSCGQKSMREAGFSEFIHLRVCDVGFAKGQSSPTDTRVERVADRAGALLATPAARQPD